jgi:lactoylglutathione lyase
MPALLQASVTTSPRFVSRASSTTPPSQPSNASPLALPPDLRHPTPFMATNPLPSPNVTAVVPFLMVTEMPRSLRFYIDGLGFTLKNKWTPDDPAKIRWCWLELGGASLMLQEYLAARIPKEKRGEGVSLCFQCHDAVALYHEFRARNLDPREPFVGNQMWDTLIIDPDGYHLHFESPTTVPEETKLSDL